MEDASARILAARPAAESGPTSLGLYIGILVYLVIDGGVIGIGSTLNLWTGLVMALGLALSTAPLAFVAIASAKHQGMSEGHRRLRGYCCSSLLAGALLGYLVLQNQPLTARMVLVSLASGFLITVDRGSFGGEPGRRAGVRRPAVHRRAVTLRPHVVGARVSGSADRP